MKIKVLSSLSEGNPFWDDPWPKNRHSVEWFFIGGNWSGTGEVSDMV